MNSVSSGSEINIYKLPLRLLHVTKSVEASRKIFTKQRKQTDKIATTRHSQTGALNKSEITDSGDGDTAVKCLGTPDRSNEQALLYAKGDTHERTH